MRRFLVFFMLFVLPTVTPALQFVTTEGFTLNNDQILTNECWVAAKAVEVNGTVEDDFIALCLGGPILFGDARLSGTFHNDVWALGHSVEFTGATAEHARLFATGEIILDGQVGLSTVDLGVMVTLTSNSVIQGDAVLVGQSVVVAGIIHGNLRILASTATLNGHFNGNVRIVADDIIVMPGTKVRGDLVYTSPRDLFLDPGKVELDGQLIRKEVETKAPPSTFYDFVLVQVYFYLCALVAGIPFMAIFPRFTGRAVRWVRQSTWKCALVGLVVLCLIPIAVLFAFFTLVGIPLSFLLLLTYTIMIYLSKIIVALAIGGGILRRHGPQPFSRVFVALSLGLIALYAATALPLVGGIIGFIVLVIGFGGMILAIFFWEDTANVPMPPATGSGESDFSVSQKEPLKKE